MGEVTGPAGQRALMGRKGVGSPKSPRCLQLLELLQKADLKTKGGNVKWHNPFVKQFGSSVNS